MTSITPNALATEPTRMGAPGVSAIRALVALAVVSGVSLVNYYDRNLIAILAEPMKHDLHLSDSQLGLLSGTAFAIVYSAAAIPVAKLADRFSRVRILGGALALWSIMTGLCGLLSTFALLVVARFGVALGESAGMPTSHAIVSDHFSNAWRGRALSVVAMMSGLGVILATWLGAWLESKFSWRAAFLAGGAGGLVFCALLLGIVREHRGPGHGAQASNFWKDAKILFGRRSFVWLCLGNGVSSMALFSCQSWIPPILIRTHGLTTSEVGQRYATIVGPATLVGIFLGGLLLDPLSRRDARWPLWLLAATFGASFPLTALFVWSSNMNVVLALAGALYLVSYASVAPGYTLVQRLCGSDLRATAAAIYLVVTNVIGLGIGPALTGFISDRLTPSMGTHALPTALLIVCSAYLVGAGLFLLGTKTIDRDIRASDVS